MRSLVARLSLSLMLLATVLVIGTPAYAQVTTTSTTLSAAVAKADNVINVTSATGFTVGRVVWVNGEGMRISSVTSTVIGVSRGQEGTQSMDHNSGDTAYVGPGEYFLRTPPNGKCTSTAQINLPKPLLSGQRVAVYDCLSGIWSQVGGNVPGMVTVQYHCEVVASCIDSSMFVATRKYQVVAARFVHGTAAGASANVEIEKLTGTTAAGSGTNILTNNSNAGFDTNATANTVQTATFTSTLANLRLAAGDRLAVDFTGTNTNTATVIITVDLVPIP